MPKIPIYNADQLPSSQMGVPQLDNSGSILSQAVASSTSTLSNATVASAQQAAEYRNNAAYRSLTQLGQSFSQMQAEAARASKAQQAYNDHGEATLVGGEVDRYSTDIETAIQQEMPDKPELWADEYQKRMDTYTKSKFTVGDAQGSVSNDNVGHLAMPGAVSTVSSAYKRLKEGGISAKSTLLQAQANELANNVDASMVKAGAASDFTGLMQGYNDIAKAAQVRAPGMPQALQDKFIGDRTKSAATNFIRGYINAFPGELEKGKLLESTLFTKDGTQPMFEEEELEKFRKYDERAQAQAFSQATLDQNVSQQLQHSEDYAKVHRAFRLAAIPENEAEIKSYINVANDLEDAADKQMKAAKSPVEIGIAQKRREQLDGHIQQMNHMLDTINTRKEAQIKEAGKDATKEGVSQAKIEIRNDHNTPEAREYQRKYAGLLDSVINGPVKTQAQRMQRAKDYAELNRITQDAEKNNPTWIAEPTIDARGNEKPADYGTYDAQMGRATNRINEMNQKKSTGGATPFGAIQSGLESIGITTPKAQEIVTSPTPPSYKVLNGGVSQDQYTHLDNWVNSKTKDKVAKWNADPRNAGKPMSDENIAKTKAWYMSQAKANPQLIPKPAVSKPAAAPKSKGKYGGLVPPPPPAAIDPASYRKHIEAEARALGLIQ